MTFRLNYTVSLDFVDAKGQPTGESRAIKGSQQVYGHNGPQGVPAREGVLAAIENMRGDAYEQLLGRHPDLLPQAEWDARAEDAAAEHRTMEEIRAEIQKRGTKKAADKTTVGAD